MKAIRFGIACLVVCVLTSPALGVMEEGCRIWHRANGEYIPWGRRLVGVEGNQVRLEKENRGGIEVFQMKEFSDDDVRLIKLWQDPSKRKAVERAIEVGHIKVGPDNEIEWHSNNWRVTDDDLALFVQAFPGIIELSIGHCGVTHKGLKALAQLKKLRKLGMSLIVDETNPVRNIEIDLRRRKGEEDDAPVVDPGFKIIAKIPSLEDLEFDGNGSVAIGKHFDDLADTKLKRLKLDNARLSADDLQRIAKIKSLEFFSPGVNPISTGIQPPLLAHLKEMKQIRGLDLDGCRLTDEDATHLQEFPQLRELHIFGWTPKGFEEIAKCQTLKTLRVLDSFEETTTDSDLAHLGKLKNLKLLWISSGKITDRGLAHLADMTQLEELYLPESITPNGLQHLERLTKLKRLDFSRIDQDEIKKPILLSHALDLLVERQGREVLDALRVLGHDPENRFRNFVALEHDLPPVDLPAMQKYGSHFTHLENFDVHEEALNEWMAAVAPLKRMRRFTISGTRDDRKDIEKRAAVTRSQLEHMAQWDQLEELELMNCDLQEDALQAIAGLQRLTEMDLVDCTLASGSMQAIGQIKSLKRLKFPLTKVSEGDLPHLAGLSNLEELFLSTPLPAKSLASLKDLKQLKKLELSRKEVKFSEILAVLTRDWGRTPREAAKMILQVEEDANGNVYSLQWDWVLPGSILLGTQNGKFSVADDDLAIVAEFPELERLVLPEGFGDAALKHLAGLKRLQFLELERSYDDDERSSVTDEGLAHLASLESLKHLDLGAATLTGAGMKHLRNLNNLDLLEMEKAQLTDEGVEPLLGLKSLKDLRFDGSRITDKGLVRLAKMPKLESLRLGFLSQEKLEPIRQRYPKIGFNGLIPAGPEEEE